MPPIISWTDFLDDPDRERVEEHALGTLYMFTGSQDDVMYEQACAEAMWLLYPREAVQYTVTLLALFRRMSGYPAC
jgi:hypothetical protein